MAKVHDGKRWAKKQLSYSFRETRDFGRASGLDQAGIERSFRRPVTSGAPKLG
jgi:hypothetical protein